jgi:hypothetical protein
MRTGRAGQPWASAGDATNVHVAALPIAVINSRRLMVTGMCPPV